GADRRFPRNRWTILGPLVEPAGLGRNAGPLRATPAGPVIGPGHGRDERADEDEGKADHRERSQGRGGCVDCIRRARLGHQPAAGSFHFGAVSAALVSCSWRVRISACTVATTLSSGTIVASLARRCFISTPPFWSERSPMVSRNGMPRRSASANFTP